MTFDPANPLGVHEGLSDDAYSEAAGERRSALKTLIGGHPHDYLYYVEQGIPDSPALRMGTAVDLMVLTPELFEEQVAVSDTQSRRGKGWDEHLKANPKKLCLSLPEFEEACALAMVVNTAPNAQKFLKGTKRQLSAFWKHTTLGGAEMICKARPDAVIAEHGRTLDLKTCQNLDDRSLTYAIHDYGYDLQGAMCCEGFMAHKDALGWEWKEHVLIFVRKTRPYDVRCVVWTLDSPWITRGLALFEDVTDRRATMIEKEQKHGWFVDVTDLPMESWISNKTLDLQKQLKERHA